MLGAILLIVLGLLAVPSLVIRKKPDAKKIFDRVAPYQGWFGVILGIFGLIDLIRCLMHINVLGITPIIWILWLATSAVTAGLGFILGYSLIKKYALKSDKAADAGEKVLSRLLPLQGTMGVIAIILGLVAIIGYILL